MGLFILNKVNKIVHVENHGFYRDDGLIIVHGNRKANDNIRKMHFKLFQNLYFPIMVDMNKKGRIILGRIIQPFSRQSLSIHEIEHCVEACKLQI